MSAGSAASKLYTTRMLMLSARLSEYPLDPALPLTATCRSKACGSSITIGLGTHSDGTVSKVGMQVTACAVGQSSAAIMADAITGANREMLCAARSEIEHWLTGEGAEPNWPGFETLLPVREHQGRHGALLLPWNAAIEALSSAPSTS